MRWRVRRVLIALMLAVATWWGLGWWLEPRPLCSLRYPGAVGKQKSLAVGRAGRQKSLAVAGQALGGDGRLWLVRYPAKAPSDRLVDDMKWDIRELATGKLLATREVSVDWISKAGLNLLTLLR